MRNNANNENNAKIKFHLKQRIKLPVVYHKTNQ